MDSSPTDHRQLLSQLGLLGVRQKRCSKESNSEDTWSEKIINGSSKSMRERRLTTLDIPTGTHLITKVRQRWARIVLGWETKWQVCKCAL
jgi:hypothetical protein